MRQGSILKYLYFSSRNGCLARKPDQDCRVEGLGPLVPAASEGRNPWAGIGHLPPEHRATSLGAHLLYHLPRLLATYRPLHSKEHLRETRSPS